MNLYIDKENIISLIKSKKNDLYGDVIRMTKKQLNVYFNFPKKDVKENSILQLWFTEFTEGVGSESKLCFEANFPVAPIKSNSYKQFTKEQLKSVYLLSDPDTSKMKNTGTLLVGVVGEEIDILNSLFLKNEDYSFESKWQIGDTHFQRWEDIQDYSLPLSDILIVDNYAIKLKAEANAINLIEINLIKYISILCNKSKDKVHLVIFTKNWQDNIEFQTLNEKIKQELECVTGKKPFLTLIHTSKEHDRTILTNYKRIISGDSFNYWNSQGRKITRGRLLEYSSLAKRENDHLSNVMIDDLQKVVDNLQQNNPDHIIGDKKSNFLNFE
ncbi:hypothetical protein N8927_03790 [Crocinitomicaceae bacterium]|nr:hypothetical protein [Crocinitomicaceae bacterium]